MDDSKIRLLCDVAAYYSKKLSQYGETPQGVDWNGEDSQVRRFEQLIKIVPDMLIGFSVNDLGCGYGALLDYLSAKSERFSYLGIDVSPDMVQKALHRHGKSPDIRFIASSQPDVVADFGVASGIFNVRVGRDDREWFSYLTDTLDVLDATSRRGFSFNCLTSYSDADKMHDYLYYADPCKLFDLCKRRYSRQVALLHDYGLYEFTILVRKR